MIQFSFTEIELFVNTCTLADNSNKKVLYTNINLKLPNKLHGPTHYKIGDTRIYNGHRLYTLL